MLTSTKPLNALILAAVSANEQADPDKFSLDAQINDSLAIADKNGWQVIDTIRIEGHSRNYRTLAQLAAAARLNSEPGFDKFIHHLEKKTFDVLIVRDANRFARKASLLYEIVDTILEDVGARIYSLSDGWVDTSNADMWLMVKGYEIRKQMNWIIKEMVRGRYKLVERGLPQGKRHVWSHMKVRDDKGKVLAFVPDPSKTTVIKLAAQLVIDRVGWNDIETRLFEMGCGHQGQPFKRFFFYHLFNNPWFWGDACRNFTTSLSVRKMALWMIDPSAPLPDGVIMYRGINQPALTGDIALRLKSELIRRINFRPRHHLTVHTFSGLLTCKRCGFMMVYASKKPWRGGYICQSKNMERSRPGCNRRWYIAENTVQAWFNAALELMLAQQNPFGLIQDDVQPVVDEGLQLRDNLAILEKQIRRLIEKQATAPDSVANLYDEQIQGLAVQRDNLLKHIQQAQQQAEQYNRSDIEAAYRELTAYETLEAFWQADSGVINQLLHRLLGNRRLVVLDHQIVGSVDAH